MQVDAITPGHARCVGRDGLRYVRTALVGEVQIDDWLLVFLDSAQEIISAERAQEVNATLDLLRDVWRVRPSGESAVPADPVFELPSAMSARELQTLVGSPSDLELESTV